LRLLCSQRGRVIRIPLPYFQLRYACRWKQAAVKLKRQYDFSKGKRGRILPAEPESEGKTRITIRLDREIVDRLFEMAEQSGGATGYQTLINAALREYLDGRAPKFEETFRREEVERLIREAIELHLQGMREDGEPIPEPHSAALVVEIAA